MSARGCSPYVAHYLLVFKLVASAVGVLAPVRVAVRIPGIRYVAIGSAVHVRTCP
jgi:hypothetical protein